MNTPYSYKLLPSLDKLLALHPDFFEQALTSTQAATFLDSTPAALAQMRVRNTGPRYHRLPTSTKRDSRQRPRGPIRYTRRHLIEWLNNQQQYSNTEEEALDLEGK